MVDERREAWWMSEGRHGGGVKGSMVDE